MPFGSLLKQTHRHLDTNPSNNGSISIIYHQLSAASSCLSVHADTFAVGCIVQPQNAKNE